jgi:hypothetical protein
MGRILAMFTAVLLSGCLGLAAAAAGGSEGGQDLGTPCDGPFKGRRPTPEEIETVLSNHEAWLVSGGGLDDPRRANFCQADLRRVDLKDARLIEANLQKASLWGVDLRLTELERADLREAVLGEAKLQGVGLWKVNFEGAFLGGAQLQQAHLRQANLQEAKLQGANLYGANLWGANLQGAFLGRATLTRVIYEPSPEGLPRVLHLAEEPTRLEGMIFVHSPAALMALREAFKNAGMYPQERQLTYAIERTKQLQAWNPLWHQARGEDPRPWLEQLARKGESLLRYALFDLPSHYGMAPGRALWGLLGLIPGFALLYWVLLRRASRHSGLWMVVPKDRIARGRGKEKIVRIRPYPAKTWWGRLKGEFRLVRASLYFSLLSAFHLGWREFTVGTWIARMQPREYTLRATGWGRFFSGLQSVVSVYLLALWALTYFGRPFEGAPW